MPRRVEDIVPAEHRRISDTAPTRTTAKKDREPSVAKSKEKEREIPIHKIKETELHMPITPPAPLHQTRKWRFRWLAVTLGIFVVIAIAGYFASTYYSRATFTIIPKTIPISVNGTKPYVAEAMQAQKKAGVLYYELATIKAIASTTVAAINGAVTNTKSTGKIIIYNNYSATPIRLIAGTRLTGSNGLLYRLTSTISIPGYTKTSSTTNPGKISTSIIADQIGQDYNITKASLPGNFGITAYKGHPKYDVVYATLLTDIAGGFTGTKKIINSAALASTTAKLKSSLTSSLLAQTKNRVPDGYIMYDNGYTVAFDAPQTSDGKTGTAVISIQATFYGILFPKNLFIDVLADNQSSSLFGDFDFTAPGLESLNVVFNNLKDLSPTKKNAMVIHVTGNMKLVGTVPMNEIKKKISGVSLTNTDAILRTYSPVIESSTGELMPPWVKIPKDISRIEVIIKNK